MGEQLVVPDALAGERLDRAVALLTGWTRSEVQELVDHVRYPNLKGDISTEGT